MITIFNSTERSLRGTEAREGAFIKVDTELKYYLHLFGNKRNSNSWVVFTCIALHSNGNGWAWVRQDTLMKMTSIATPDALSAAIKHLRNLEIEGNRILDQYRLQRPDGRMGVSYYHIFPHLGGEPPELGEGFRLVKVTESEEQTEVEEGLEPPPDYPGLDKPGLDNHVLINKSHLKQEKNRAAPAAVQSDWPPGTRPQVIEVPQYGPQGQRAAFTAPCQACQAVCTQASDVCPGCGHPLRWEGLASKWKKARLAASADRKAKEMRQGQARLSATTKWLLDEAIRTSPIGEASYPKGLEQKIFVFEGRYGADEIKRITRYMLAGDRPASGNGLLHAVEKALQKKEQGGVSFKSGKTPWERSAQPRPPERQEPIELVRKDPDLNNGLEFYSALAGVYGPEWQAKARALKQERGEGDRNHAPEG